MSVLYLIAGGKKTLISSDGGSYSPATGGEQTRRAG